MNTCKELRQLLQARADVLADEEEQARIEDEGGDFHLIVEDWLNKYEEGIEVLSLGEYCGNEKVEHELFLCSLGMLRSYFDFQRALNSAGREDPDLLSGEKEFFDLDMEILEREEAFFLPHFKEYLESAE